MIIWDDDNNYHIINSRMISKPINLVFLRHTLKMNFD